MFGDARIIAVGHGIVARHAPALAVHVAEVPVGHQIAVVGGVAEQLHGAVVIAVPVGALRLLEVVGPERNRDFGKLDVGRGRKIGIEFGKRALLVIGGGGGQQQGENGEDGEHQRGRSRTPSTASCRAPPERSRLLRLPACGAPVRQCGSGREAQSRSTPIFLVRHAARSEWPRHRTVPAPGCCAEANGSSRSCPEPLSNARSGISPVQC